METKYPQAPFTGLIQKHKDKKCQYTVTQLSLYSSIGLYVNGELIEHYKIPFYDFDEMEDELRRAGFTRGYTQLEVAHKREEVNRAREAFLKAWANEIK
jgi:hypothetical protein